MKLHKLLSSNDAGEMKTRNVLWSAMKDSFLQEKLAIYVNKINIYCMNIHIKMTVWQRELKWDSYKFQYIFLKLLLEKNNSVIFIPGGFAFCEQIQISWKHFIIKYYYFIICYPRMKWSTEKHLTKTRDSLKRHSYQYREHSASVTYISDIISTYIWTTLVCF